jgi:hypothetical protein
VNRDNTSIRASALCLGLAFVVIFFFLAFSAFVASRVVDSDSRAEAGKNLYLSSNQSINRRLGHLLKSQSKGLEYMVWEQERGELSRSLSKILWQRINLQPLNGSNWLQLSSLQKDAGVSISDRAWTLERASTLLRWNINDTTRISHYCIAEHADFTKFIADLCSSLIAKLPSAWSDSYMAARVEVPLSVLQSVLALERAKLSRALSDGGGSL